MSFVFEQTNRYSGTSPTIANRNWRWLFWLALGVMLASRLALVLGPGREVQQWSDLGWYLARAVELVETGRYSEQGVPTAFWPVGYPAFLAGVMTFTSPAALPGQLANIALSVATLVLLYRWCLKRFTDERVAGTAALMLAIYPNHMGYSVGLYSEPLFTTLLLAIFVLVDPQARLWRIALAGILAGLATLVKAQMLLLGPLLLLGLSVSTLSINGLSKTVGRALLGTALMAAVIAPWTYRNQVVMGATIPVSTNGGMSLLAANNPSMTTTLSSDYNDDSPLVRDVRFSVKDQVAADTRARSAAWGWIRENPTHFFALMPKKLFRLWAPDGESEWIFQTGYPSYNENKTLFRSVRIINQIYYTLIIIGFFLAWRLWLTPYEPSTWTVPLMLAFFSVLSMVFSGQSRYHAPMMPFVIAFAAWSVLNVRRKKTPS